MRIVTLVLRLTPYGILALMAKTVAGSNLDAIVKLGKFVIASYVALIAMFIIHLIILAIMGLSPKQYLKKFGLFLLLHSHHVQVQEQCH